MWNWFRIQIPPKKECGEMRLRAQNPRHTHAYHVEPYTVQHFCDWLIDMPKAIGSFVWYVFRHLTSKTFRLEQARMYNSMMFGSIPTEQIMVLDGDRMRPLRPEERTWPE